MSIAEKLQALKLEPWRLEGDATVCLTYSEELDVPEGEDPEETAIAETSVVGQVAELLLTPGLKNITASYFGGTPILENLRNLNRDPGKPKLLDESKYETGDEHFIAAADVIRDNTEQACIQSETEWYGRSGATCKLTAEVYVPVSEIIEADLDLEYGWRAKVEFDGGEITLEA